MSPLDAQEVAQRVLAAARSSTDPYAALLLPRTATFQEARAEYKKLLFLHPDKNPGNELASEAFKVVTAAFEKVRAANQLPLDVPHLEGARRWSAFTEGPADRGHASYAVPAAAPPAAPAPAPPPGGPRSKWGRPSSAAQRLLAVPQVQPQRQTAPAPRPQAQPLSSPDSISEGESDLEAAPSDADDAAVQGFSISGPDFYGSKRKRTRQAPLGEFFASKPAPAAAPAEEKVSKWGQKPAGKTSLAEFLKTSRPLGAPLAPLNANDAEQGRLASEEEAVPAKRPRKRVIIDTESGEWRPPALPQKLRPVVCACADW